MCSRRVFGDGVGGVKSRDSCKKQLRVCRRQNVWTTRRGIWNYNNSLISVRDFNMKHDMQLRVPSPEVGCCANTAFLNKKQGCVCSLDLPRYSEETIRVLYVLGFLIRAYKIVYYGSRLLEKLS